MNYLVKQIALSLREAFAITLWLLVFTKIFVYDIDLLLVSRVRWLQRLYPYKFFLIFASIAVLWLILGGKYARKVILYVAGYPLVVLLWRIPKLLFKNWATLLIFAPAIESIAFTLKWRFALASFAMLAALVISLVMNSMALTFCMSFLGIYLLVHYILRLRIAYRPESIFANIAPAVGTMWKNGIKTFKDTESADRRKGNLESPEFRKKHVENLRALYTYNLVWTHVATKLREAVSSRRTDLYFIVALVYTFVLTVGVFGFEYWGLFKIDSSSFITTGVPTPWAFFLFSFNAVIHTSFATMTPISAPALAFANAELIAGLIIFLFFVFVILTSHRERYRQDINSLVERLSHSADAIEHYIRRELKMKLIDVEVTIIAQDPSFSTTIQSFGRTPPPIVLPQEKESESI
jgi:hypothetical protein